VAKPTIVFDLDGTLVDTAGDLIATLNTILVREKMVPVTIESATALVGSGARVMIEAAFAAEGRALTPGTLDRLLADYLAHYNEHLADTSRAYPGVEAALDRFATEGWLLAVCTNKFEAPARKLLELIGLTPRFAAITGQNTFGFRKPDPRHLTETIRLAGGDIANAIMVGDSTTDIETGRAANIPVVAVTFGYSPIPVADLKPTRTIDHFDALWDAVSAIRRPLSP
jgi:phosphoglycolate phosphatase